MLLQRASLLLVLALASSCERNVRMRNTSHVAASGVRPFVVINSLQGLCLVKLFNSNLRASETAFSGERGLGISHGPLPQSTLYI